MLTAVLNKHHRPHTFQSVGIHLISAFFVFCIGCTFVGNKDRADLLSKADALALAVALANEQCFKTYSEQPFTEDSYTMTFENGRWRWGHLDLSGQYGYSAVVSFDSKGEDRVVEVFYSSDKPKPVFQ
jgi:hypothetical protein